jgi:hypothetical protein
LAVVVGAGVVACAAADGINLSSKDTGGAADAGVQGAAAPTAGDRSNTPGGASGLASPTSNGVILVHAAAFPSFRLCFSNLLDLVPQPDSKVMPEANVVGVELGSVVRIDPLATPVGTIYVINESEVRSSANDPNEPKCGELLGQPTRTPRTLTKDNAYHVIQTPVTTPLGVNKVEVLAITGCGSQAFLNGLDNVSDASSANCGSGWNTTSGNLQQKIVDLTPTANGATSSSLPVQLFHMSPAIETFRGPTGSLKVSFGPLTGGGSQQTLSIGALFTGGDQITVPLDQTKAAVYGANGFDVSVTGGPTPFDAPQSLADIQQLSAPTELPTTYYRTASNYALMLLGDPSHLPTLSDGGVNPDFNPRRAVHFLAVPVIDPSQIDAGAPDSGTTPTTLDAGH